MCASVCWEESMGWPVDSTEQVMMGHFGHCWASYCSYLLVIVLPKLTNPPKTTREPESNASAEGPVYSISCSGT